MDKQTIAWSKQTAINTSLYNNDSDRPHHRSIVFARWRRTYVSPSNTRFLGLTRSCQPNDISIGSAVFAGLTVVTNTQTYRPMICSISSNCPHLALQCRRCWLKQNVTYTLPLLVGRDLAVVDSEGRTSNIARTSRNLPSSQTPTSASQLRDNNNKWRLWMWKVEVYWWTCGPSQLACSKGCSVLFFSRPWSKGWPHHEHTIYLCPLPFWLTLPWWVLSTLDVVHPGCVWSSSPACTWHCSLHYLFLQATPLFPHAATIVC